jgi:S1-C subfamily serine protease
MPPPHQAPPPVSLALVALLAALAAAGPAGGPALAQPAAAPAERFRILNRTGAEAVALHAVRTGRGDWGRNLLDRPLPPDAGFYLRPSGSAGCRFDIRLVLGDGREARAQDVDVCANRTVVLDAAAAAAAAAAPGKPTTAAPGGPAAAAPARPAPASPGVRPNPNAGRASGTGFVVAPDRVLTNQHVIDGCNRVLVRAADDRWLAATPPARVDRERDLALLAVPGDPGPPLAFRGQPEIRRGEGVVTYGFPLSGLLSSGPTLTTGEVSAMAGLRDNPRQFQISAPVQPGNSGGPLLDRQGHVVGVVVSKLNAQRVAQHTGDIPQNVNFAVKGTEALAFLRSAGVTPLLADSRGAERGAAEVGETAHRSTVFIRCER